MRSAFQRCCLFVFYRKTFRRPFKSFRYETNPSLSLFPLFLFVPFSLPSLSCLPLRFSLSLFRLLLPITHSLLHLLLAFVLVSFLLFPLYFTELFLSFVSFLCLLSSLFLFVSIFYFLYYRKEVYLTFYFFFFFLILFCSFF